MASIRATAVGGALFGALLIGALLATAAPGRAADDGLSLPAHEHELDNGLRLVVIPWDSPGVITYATLVRTGSRDEVERGRSGFAHFFEHMMFRGTPRYSAAAYREALQELGAEDNALTSDDRTLYYIVAPASGLETLIEIEADRFQNLAYSEQDFRTEALAVLGEYNASASDPLRRGLEALRRKAFRRHPYGHSTLGLLEDIRAMPEHYEASLRFFDRFYRPDNVFLIVVGDVEPQRVLELVEQAYGDWQPGYEPVEVPREPPLEGPVDTTLEVATATQPWLLLGFRAPAFSVETADVAGIDVLAHLLFSDTAPLHRQLVLESRSVDLLAGALTDHRDPYLFEVLVRIRNGVDMAEVERVLEEALESASSQPVPDVRLQAIKDHLRYELSLDLDGPDDVAELVGHYLALNGSLETIPRLFDHYQEVTSEDVQRLADELFRPENRVRVRVLPARHGEELPAVGAP